MRSRNLLLAAALLATAAGPPGGSPLAADSLLLANGNRFEGVVAEISDQGVVIRLDFGEITLPRDSVLEIERSPSALEEYLRRFERLSAEDETTGEEWLELALWARRRGLEHGFSEALRRAADLEPEMPALAAPMRSLGYLFDQELGLWLSIDDSMRRRGMVRSGDQWLTREELAALNRAREEERRLRREEAQQERLARAVELLALAQVERTRADSRPVPVALGYPLAGVPVAAFSGIAFGGFRIEPQRPPTAPAPVRQGGSAPSPGSVADQLLRRQPGSIIPIRNPEVRVVRVDRAGGR